LDDPVCSDHTTLIKVARPAAQQRVQFSDSLLGRVKVPPRRRFVVDSLDDTLERFAGRLGADEGFAVLPVEPPDREPEEVERLLRYARQSGLSVINRQAHLSHQPPHHCKRSHTVAGAAADHKIISIVDDMRIESVSVTMVVPRQKEASEVEIRKERRCRSSLRGTPIPVASFSRAEQPSAGCSFPYRRREPPFEHRQYGTVGYSTGDTPHQRPVRDCRKIVAQIRVYYVPSVVLSDMEVRPANRHLGIHIRTEPVLLRSQVFVEDGTEDQHHGGLDYSVLDSRDAQRSLATIPFWYPHTQEGLWRV
jgi:hypothetical protein